MANRNHYALLVDDENDDPSALFERVGAVARAAAVPKDVKKTAPPVAKLPSKPPPPAQAVKESQSESGRGRGRAGRTGGRGNYGSRDSRVLEGASSRPPREGGLHGSEQNDRSFSSSRGGFTTASTPLNGEVSLGVEESGRSNDLGGGRGRGRIRGRGRGYGSLGEEDERLRQRQYDRRSGTGRGNELKREGAGRGNWGHEIDAQRLLLNADPGGEEEKPSLSPEIARKETEDAREGDDTEKQDEEDKEMTLEEYEKVLSEKRKNMDALKAKERKVTLDKDFASMKLVNKKNEEDSFLKLGGADKGKKKESTEKDERSKKPLSINEFLRPVDSDGYFSPSGRRGRGGRGHGDRGSFRGGFGAGYSAREAMAPSIEDPSHFPTLGGK